MANTRPKQPQGKQKRLNLSAKSNQQQLTIRHEHNACNASRNVQCIIGAQGTTQQLEARCSQRHSTAGVPEERKTQPAGAQAHESVEAIHPSHSGKPSNNREKRSTVASRSSSNRPTNKLPGATTQQTIKGMWYSGAKTQPATTSKAALDLSGMTTHSADHNVQRNSDHKRIRLNMARHQQPAQVCFLTVSRQAQPKLPGSLNLPKQLTIQLNTKPNLLSTYSQGSRPLNKALLALTKLEWEESLTQKLKSERRKPSTGICEVIQTCNYFALLPQVDLQLQTGINQNS
ncbi:hypothetical protein F511_06613 [Dorcoceras hygrometricum]|uniref:Uncharacterized protein n=1 Tax=Dorcoceras hygrometricum TaxID=472368 RepID=A0A2Z7B596_9LAMI|nr:hypothetical protein F511_06613 [Dorcoceras hygrometricum]